MNVSKLERKLLAAARTSEVSEAVPYAFSKRVMARLTSGKGIDQWSWWAVALWRAAAPCVAIMVGLSAWTYYETQQGTSDLSQDFDNTVLAAVQQAQALDSNW
jgi:hypothetical protein